MADRARRGRREGKEAEREGWRRGRGGWMSDGSRQLLKQTWPRRRRQGERAGRRRKAERRNGPLSPFPRVWTRV